MRRLARIGRDVTVAAATRLPRSWVGRAVRLSNPAVRRGEVFASFERDEGRPLPLLKGYRDYGKGRWRDYWWATRALFALDARGLVTQRSRGLVEALRVERTLPAPLEEFAAEAAALAGRFPDLIQPTGRIDPRLSVPMLAAVRSEAEAQELARVYANGARAVAAVLRQADVDLARASVLEAGCGRGYTAAAMSGTGAGEVVGIDLDLQGEALPAEIRWVRETLAGEHSVTLVEGDLRGLPYADEVFDAVYSLAVLEHVDDLSRAFRELRRVTKPGGIGYHGIDPWFGPAGGHSLCTLDAPWGHVRVSEREFERYLRELRPHEADEAIAQYQDSFQRPRLRLSQTAAAARGVGFEVLSSSLTRLRLLDPHRGWLSAHVLRDCRRVFPAVEPNELLSVSGTLVLRRR